MARSDSNKTTVTGAATTSKKVAKKKVAQKTVTKKAATKKAAPKKSTAKKVTTKKTAVKTATRKVSTAKRKKTVISADERRMMVAMHAYYKWEKAGFPGGQDWQHWLEAEREVEEMFR